MPAAPAALISRIGQISMNAHDLERATAFYRDTLGLRYLFTARTMAFFDCGGVRLMLGLPEKPEFDHPGSILYYEVADIGEAHRALLDRGVKFEQDPLRVATLETHELWLAFFRDSEGNLLSLMSNVPLARERAS